MPCVVVEFDVSVLRSSAARSRALGELFRCASGRTAAAQSVRAPVELEHSAGVRCRQLGVGHLLLHQRVAREGHQRTRQASHRLDGMRRVPITETWSKNDQVLAGILGMGGQIRSRCGWQPLRARPRIARETERLLDVDGPLGVVTAFPSDVRTTADSRGSYRGSGVPVGALVGPVLMPLFVVAGFDKKNSISICSNSRVRENGDCRGDLVCGALLPIWAIPDECRGGGHHVLE